MSATKKLSVTLADWQPTQKQKDSVNQVMNSGRLTYGPMTQELEAKFARLHNRKYSIFTNSGTSALQVALQSLKNAGGWQDGDEVLVPAVTFVATVNVILHCGLKPVLVDVTPDCFDIDVTQLGDKVTKRTRAIIPVHLLGQPCDIEGVMAIAETFDLKVVEDSCETMFVTYAGKPVGSWGDFGCFSSYLAHIISTGVGGFLTVDNIDDEKMLRSLIWHGRDPAYLSIDANKTDNLEELMKKRFLFNQIGWSYRLTELEAALGIDEVDRWHEIIKARQANAQYITNALKSSELLQLPTVRPKAENSWMFYPLVVHDPINRDKLALYLEEQGIQTRTIMPLINQPVYKGMWDPNDYPVADFIDRHGLLVGCHQFLTIEQLDYLCQHILIGLIK